MSGLRSGLQRLGEVPEDPHRYANAVKPASAMSVLKKAKPPQSSPGQCYDSWSADGGFKPPREASRGSPWLPLDGELSLQAACAPKPTPWRPDGTSTRRAATPAPLPTPEGKSRPRGSLMPTKV